MKFGQIALQQGLITQQQLKSALEIQQQKKDWQLGEILAFLGYIDNEQIGNIVQFQQISSDINTRSPDSTDNRKQVSDLQVDHPSSIRFEERYFGRYRLLAEIGHGGMGRVYKAYDSRLDRIVAIKVLISGQAASSQEIERFLREAKATAQLRHPNIVAVYDMGNQDGQNYFTMDFVEGLSLKKFLRQFPLTSHQIVDLMVDISEAVHYAHTRDIIHRDIKPSNIMIDEDNQPKIMDFGLAKMISVTDSSLSQTGDVIGTPAYMSPEQSSCKTIDYRSDVYSLGTTLYEALTGRPPFQGQSRLYILYPVFHTEPLPLRMLNPGIPVELEAICLKCLEKNPYKRYQNAQAFAQDLKNFLADRPVTARSLTVWKYLKKYIFRHRAFPVLAIVVLLITLFTGILFFVQWRIAIEKNWQLDQENKKMRKQLEILQGK